MNRRRRQRPRDLEDPDPYLPGHGDLAFEVESYDIELDYRVSSNRLHARAQIVAVAHEPMTLVRLDLHDLDVRKVRVNGARPVRYSHHCGKLIIHLAAAAAPGDRLEIVILYGGQPGPLPSIWGEVGWEELSDGVIVASQPGGAPSWFPCNDRPSSKATYRLGVTTESAYTVLANGLLVDQRRGASRMTWTYEQAQPMATYLATVQIGRYEIHTSTGSPVPQRFLAPSKLRSAALADLARQSAMLEVFTDLFGPYPFDEYTVVVTQDDLEIPLEAQGLAVFGANHIDGRQGFERLVAHELAHQWFGNSLTARQWSDIWLHEGFACYAEWLWSERSGGKQADLLARHHHQRLTGAAQDLRLSDPGPPAMFDDRLYKRGALALHALRLTLGDDTFFTMIRAWVAQHRFGTVTTELFEEHAASYGRTGALLARWLHGRPLPDLPSP
jgi:aminopeptidase N